MNEFDHLSDHQLSALINKLALTMHRAHGELNNRQTLRLEAAYGHELAHARAAGLEGGTETLPDGTVRIVWCFYCGERPGWQREHKLPRSRGGTDAPANIVRSCSTCNYRKGTMTFEEYRASLERRSGNPHVFFGERVK